MKLTKPLNIFKAGKHTASNGSLHEFSEDTVQEIVDSYDPALFMAPMVVGHPQANMPAYGWAKSLSYDERTGIEAEPDQVDPEFADMVNAGRFKYISASIYAPDSPYNPKPGSYYLRHIGFLGAQPPAVKGLRPAEFADASDGVLEFMSTWPETTNASLWRRFREWMIGKEGLEAADKVVPDYAVQDLEAGARNSQEGDKQPVASAYNEPNDNEDVTMTKEELQAAATKLAADQAKLATDQATFAEAQTKAQADAAALATREQAIAAQEAAMQNQAHTDFVEALVKEGKVLPAQKGGLIAVLASMDQGKQIEFGEGATAVKTDSVSAFKTYLKSLPKLVEYGEVSGEEKGAAVDNTDANAIATAIDAERKRVLEATGKEISFSEAAANVTKANKK